MKEHCAYYPTVIVPGIGQSKVDYCSLDGRRLGCAWPLDLDEKALLKRLAPSAAGMLLTRRDDKFLATLKTEISRAVSPLEVNREGVPTANLRVVDYGGRSLGECSEDEKRYIYKMVPMQELSEVIGEDHMFFFAYHSFGQPYETAKHLHEYIQNVKRVTGHTKVNLVPVSLGGSIATAYFDAYGDRGDIHRVCYFVPAANGSTLIRDVFTGDLDFSEPRSLLSLLLGDGTASQIMRFAGTLPKGSFERICRTVIDAVCETFLRNCPGMWAVLPKEYYPALRDAYLCDGRHTALLAKTERFYRAQSHLGEVLKKAEALGTKFFSICGYDNALLPFSGTKNLNSDTIVDFVSASLGGTAAPAGQTLPEGYEGAHERCSDKSHCHISPERTVDLGTALFPDSTFCFRYQVHDDTAYNDVALLVSREILTNEAFTGVYSDPRFPQFNGSRNIFRIRYRLLPKAEELLKTELHPTLKKELLEAMEEANSIFENTIIADGTRAEKATARLSEAVDAATPDYRK